MGRTVVYDNHVQKSINDLVQSGAKCLAVGVVIGQSTQQRDMIIHIASCPKKDDEDPQQKEGDVKRFSKSSRPQQGLDESWVCQHARQVTRMLPGGLDILGLFAVAPTEVLTAAQHKLREALFSVFRALARDQKSSPNAQVSEKILLQVCSRSCKATCKTFDISDSLSTAKPAEWKSFPGGAPKWHRLEAMLSLSLWAAQSQECCSQSLLKQMQDTLQPFFRAVDAAAPLVDGEVHSPEEGLDPGERRRSRSREQQESGGTFVVDLFLPLWKTLCFVLLRALPLWIDRLNGGCLLLTTQFTWAEVVMYPRLGLGVGHFVRGFACLSPVHFASAQHTKAGVDLRRFMADENDEWHKNSSQMTKLPLHLDKAELHSRGNLCPGSNMFRTD